MAIVTDKSGKAFGISLALVGLLLCVLLLPPTSIAGPLDNWHWRNPKDIKSVIHWSGDVDGGYVAVGEAGTILTSTNGTDWTARASGTSNTLNGIAYKSGMFVAVGESGTILTSTNGTTWTARASDTSNSLLGIIYDGQSTFVAVGESGTILTSTNGTSWTTGTSGTSNSLRGVAYGYTTGGAKFVAVGDSGTILTSSTGTVWDIVEGTPTSSTLKGITYGYGMFIAVGESGTIITSALGITWSLKTSGTSNTLNGVTYSYYYPDTFVAVGESGTILTSALGIAWSSQTSGTSNTLNGVAPSPSSGVKSVVVGATGTILTSTNGTTWTSVYPGWLYSVAYGNSLYVTAGLNGTIFTSSDASSWTARTSGISSTLNGITYGTPGGVGYYVAVGNSGTILTSTDGTTWEFHESYPDFKGVAYGNGYFVALGYYGSSGTIHTSPGPDASGNWTWTEQTSGTSYTLTGVAYGNSVYVAVGYNGTILTSTNGISWTSRTSGTPEHLNGITYGNGTFVAVGYDGTILTSSDGVSWYGQSSGTATSTLYGVAYGNGTFAAVGSGAGGSNGEILTSTGGDASGDWTWSQKTSGTSNYLNSVVYGNSAFTAVGSSAVILQSDADTTPPSGNISINSGATYSTSAVVTLTLQCADDMSCYQMRFSNDNIDWSAAPVAFATSTSYTLPSGDGTKTVYVKFQDGAGNWSTAYSDTITLDTAAPTGSISINSGATYSNSTSVTLTLSCTDSGSGCSQMRFSNDNSDWSASPVDVSTNASYTLPSGDGAKTVYVKFRDNAGNWSSAYSDSIILDTTLPTGSISINSGAAYCASRNVTLTLSCSDTGGSGCSQMQFSNVSDSSGWSTPETYATSKPWTLSSGDGAKTVYVKFKDGAGNWSTSYSDTIVLDTSPPTTTAPSLSAGTYTGAQTVSLSSDDPSANIYYTGDGTDPRTSGTRTLYTGSISLAASTLLTYYAVDAAGNASSLQSQTYTIQYAVTVGKSGTGSGTATSTPSGINCGSDCSENYSSGTSVTLTAAANANSSFTGWSGGGCSGTGACTLTIDAAKNITANFYKLKGLAYVANNSSSSVSVIEPSDNVVVATISVDPYPYGVAVSPAGATVYVAHSPVSGGAKLSVIDASTNTVTATLTMGTASAAGIAVNPAGTRAYIAHGNDRVVSVIDTSANTVAATVNVGSSPTGVAVNPSGTQVYVTNYNDNNVSVIDAGSNTVSTTIIAGFSSPYGIAVSPDGGRVYVTNALGSSVSVINALTNTVIQTVTVGSYPYGITVNPYGTRVYVTNYNSHSVSVIDASTYSVTQVTAGANPFKNPLGVAVSPSGDRVYVTNVTDNSVSVIDASTNAVTNTVTVGSAPYSFGQFIGPDVATLTVTKSGTGLGTVTSSPSGISCGSSCTKSFVLGSSVILAADADSQSNFTGWSGGGCSGTGSCTVSMDASKNVGAIFTLKTHALEVTKSGTGTGSVTPSIGTLSWDGNLGTAIYDSGTTVTLTAAADASSSFTSWSGDCSGSTCTITMGASKRVTATFSDAVAPTGSISINSGAAYCASRNVTLTLSCSDTGGSGCSQMQFSNVSDSSGWSTPETYATSKPWTLSSGDGAKTVYVKFKDAAGNWSSAYSAAITLDTAIPATSPSASTGAYNNAQTITLTADDPSANIYYTTNGDTPTTGSPHFTGTGSISIASTTTLKYFTRDIAGNASAVQTQTYTITYTLTVTKSGTGSGTISSSGISCGTDCSENYTSGTHVTLDASPAAGSSFTSWSGDCSGNSTCTVTMDAAKNVVAKFYDTKGLAYVTRLSAGNAVSVIDPSSNTVVATMPVSGVYGVAVNPARTRVYVTGQGANTVSVIDTATNIVTATVNVGVGPQGVAVHPAGTKVYAANFNSNTISVIDTSTNTVTATVSVGTYPRGVAVNPAGTRVYVTNNGANTVSVINTSTNTVTATVSVAEGPIGVFVHPAGTRVYVANESGNSVSVIDTSTNTVAATISVGQFPYGVVVNPAGTRAYVSNRNSNTVSVIDTSSNTVAATVNVGAGPYGIAVNPYGTKVYVANYSSGTVSVIDTSSNVVTGTPISIGSSPLAFGQFIGLDMNLLNVARTGTGSGIVRSLPEGINCGDVCAVAFPSDGSVTLDASANAGSAFTGWSGDCTGTGTCTIAMGASKNVTATFSDAAAPTGSVSINSGASYSTDPSGNVTLTLSCSDTGGSGCSQMQFSNVSDSSGWSTPESYATSKSWTLSSGDGPKTVYVKFKDAAGNWSSAYSDTITLDATVPSTSPSVAGGTYSGVQSITLSGEVGSTIYYTLNGDTPSRSSSVYTSPISISSTTTVKYFAVDAAGNQETVKTSTYTITYTLTISKTGTGQGTVTSTGINCGSDCSENYNSGTSLTLEASAAAGSIFAGWSGTCSDASSTCTLTINASENVTAAFRTLTEGLIAHYPFSGNAGDESGGGNNGTVNGATQAADRFGNQNSAYSFNGLNDYIEKDNPSDALNIGAQSWTMSSWIKTSSLASQSITSRYECGWNCLPTGDRAAKYQLYISSGKVSFTVRSDDDNEVTATSDADNSDGSWHHVVGVLDRNSSSVKIFIDGHQRADASGNLTSLTDSGSPFEVGRFFVQGFGTPTDYFDGSIDDVRVYNRALSALEITALYAMESQGKPLAVSKSGTGLGRVTSYPAGIDCGSTCSTNFSTGISVTLTATADTGSSITGWSGCNDVSGNTCTVAMDSSKNVTATFSDAASPTGTISINSGAAYCASSNVTLALTCTDNMACSQMRFSNVSDSSGWSTPETYDSSKSWTLSSGDGPKTVHVKFKDTAGNWSSAYSAAITLDTAIPATSPSASTGTYNGAQSVTLTADDPSANIYYTTNGDTPTTGSPHFTGTGSISIASTTTLKYFTRDVAGNASAVQTQTYTITYTLTVTRTGTGTGTVLASGINCGSDCSENYTSGTTVTLDASPAAGSAFTSWSGDCSGNSACTVTMGASKSVTAAFTKLTISLTGSVIDATGNPISSALVVNMGDPLSNVATTDSSGNFTLSGMPWNTNFWLKITKTGYHDTYTGNHDSSSNIDNTASPYTLYTDDDIASWYASAGVVRDPSKGVIVGRAYAQVSPRIGYVKGVQLTSDYPVVYFNTDGAIAPETTTNGRFAILNVNDGDTVTVTGTKTGWTGFERIFKAVADSVSMGRLVGSTASTISFTGTVNNGTNLSPIQGASIQLYGNSAVATTTDISGNFTLGGLPPDTTFQLKVFKSGFLPTYTSNVNLSGDYASPRYYSLYTQANLNSWGVQKGLIAGRVMDDADPQTGYLSGATVSYTSARYPVSPPYAVKYRDASGNFVSGQTYTDGRYYIFDVEEGDTVQVMASLPGWDFTKKNPKIFTTHSSAVSLSTLFGEALPVLTVDASGSGTITSSPTAINCGSACSSPFTQGAAVILEASPNAGCLFTSWSGDCSGNTSPTSVVMDASRSCTAVFTLKTYSISSLADGSGNITCTPSTVVYDASSSCTITPDAGYHLVSLTDNSTDATLDVSGNTYILLNVSANHTISAAFAINTYTFTPTSGTNGSIAPSTATTTNYGSSQTFSITPDTGYHVVDVLVDGVSQGAVSTYTFTNTGADHAISATFAINTYSLTVNATGTGTGTITSSPSGIDCGSVCTYTYDYGTEVALVGTPGDNSAFSGFSGGGCQGDACTIAISSDTRVTANFYSTLGPPLAYVSVPGTNTVSVINTALNKVVRTIQVDSSPTGVAIHPAGTHAYVTNSYANSVSVIDTSSNLVTATIPVGARPMGIAVGASGRKAYVANSDGGTVSVIDTSSNMVTATIPVGGHPWGVASGADGRTVYVAIPSTNALSVINSETDNLASTIQVDSPIGVAAHPSGRVVYVTSTAANAVFVIDTVSGTATATISTGVYPSGAVINPAGTRLYVANQTSNTLSVIDTSSNTQLTAITVGRQPIGVSIHPDGTRVYVANFGSSNVSVINAESNSVTDTILMESGPFAFGQFVGGVTLTNISVSPDSNDFGSVMVGIPSPQTFTLTNGGAASLSVGAITLTGDNAEEFILTDDTCSGSTVPPLSHCTLRVSLYSAKVGPKNATLSIPSSDMGAPVLGILLTGNSGILLSAGWNFVSFPEEPTDNAIERVLADISSSVVAVWSFDNQTKQWLRYRGQNQGVQNTLATIEAGKGYWIYADETGTLAPASMPSPAHVPLYEGWNLVGYKGSNNTSIESSLSGLSDRWSIVWNWDKGSWKYMLNGPLSSAAPSIFGPVPLTKFNRGKAYWIKIKSGAGNADWAQ